MVKFCLSREEGLLQLDEPSTCLDQREQNVLVEELKQLRDQGNSILVIEHSDILEEKADHLVELGPGSGLDGGEIVFSGKPQKEAGESQKS